MAGDRRTREMPTAQHPAVITPFVSMRRGQGFLAAAQKNPQRRRPVPAKFRQQLRVFAIGLLARALP
jgi:hypothetical protein